MTNLTQNEMSQINGAGPESHHDVNTDIWAEEKAVGGVMSSLQNKGLIWACIDRQDPDYSGCGFTEADFEAWSADERADKS